MATIDKQGQLMLDQPLTLDENRRVEVIILVQEPADPFSEFEDDTPNEEILADLRQAWQEALTGQTIPVSQLWNDSGDE